MNELDRREILKRTGAGLAGAFAVGGMITASSSSTVSASGLTASDVTVSTNDGELNSLTFKPDITVSWAGREDEVATVEATWFVKTSTTSETQVGPSPETISVETPTKDGSVDHSYGSDIDLLSQLSASNFEATTDGGSESTEVTLSMDATLKNANSGTIVSKVDVLGPKGFTVTVNNESSSVSSSGTANTSGS